MSCHHRDCAERPDEEGPRAYKHCPDKHTVLNSCFILSDPGRDATPSSSALEFWWHRVLFYLSINKGCDFTYSSRSFKKHIFLNVQPFGIKPCVQLLSEEHHYKLSKTQTRPPKLWDDICTFKCVSWRIILLANNSFFQWTVVLKRAA